MMESSTSSDNEHEEIFRQFEKHWDQLYPKLEVLLTNLRNLLVDTNFPLADDEYITNIENFGRQISNLKNNMSQLLQISNQIQKDESEGRKELQCLQERYDKVLMEKVYQEERVCNLENQLRAVSSQFENQNAYFMSLGSILGHLLWTSTEEHSTVPTLLKNQEEMIQFFHLVKESLVSFVDTYKNEMPAEHSNESVVVWTMVRVLLNITAHETGRQFILAHPTGSLLIQTFLDILPDIPHPSGDKLKQSILKTVFNISLDVNAELIIEQHCTIWKSLSQIIDRMDESSETKFISLTLLASLLRRVKKTEIVNAILNIYTEQKIQQWFTKTSSKCFAVLKDIRDNLNSL